MSRADRGAADDPLAFLAEAEGDLPGRSWETGWVVPLDVRLDGDDLVFGWDQGWTSIEAGRDLQPLAEFAALATGTDDRILRFARRWGVLDICEHGVPATHRRPDGLPWPGVRGGSLGVGGCRPAQVPGAGGDLGTFREPLSAWRLFAHQARSALVVAANIAAGKPPQPEDLRRLRWHPNAAGGAVGPVDVDQAHDRLIQLAEGWLVWADVRLAIETLTVVETVIDAAGNETEKVIESWTPVLSGPTLFGALAIQLSSVVTQAGGLAICSGCGNPYAPPRKPTAGRRRYCEPCRAAGIPIRDAQRAASARRRRGTVTDSKADSKTNSKAGGRR